MCDTFGYRRQVVIGVKRKLNSLKSESSRPVMIGGLNLPSAITVRGSPVANRLRRRTVRNDPVE